MESNTFKQNDLPEEWEKDASERYRLAPKADAVNFFEGNGWATKVLSQAAIDLRNGKKVYFVTSGWAQSWEEAEKITVQKIKDVKQLESEFSGDVPQGYFYVK